MWIRNGAGVRYDVTLCAVQLLQAAHPCVDCFWEGACTVSHGVDAASMDANKEQGGGTDRPQAGDAQVHRKTQNRNIKHHFRVGGGGWCGVLV